MAEEEKEEWNKLKEDVSTISQITIPRYIGSSVTILCSFADASFKAFGCAVYSKSNQDVHLLFAKAKLAPVKEDLSITRLELMGVLIASRNIRKIKKSFLNENMKMVLWSDSKCVLSWLRSTRPLSVKFCLKTGIFRLRTLRTQVITVGVRGRCAAYYIRFVKK